MKDTEREAETQAEGEAGSMQRAWCGTPSWDSRIAPWAKGRRQTTAPPRDPQRFYLFIHERHRERGRDTGRGRSRLHVGSPMQDLIPGPWDHTPELKAGAKPLSTQVPTVWCERKEQREKGGREREKRREKEKGEEFILPPAQFTVFGFYPFADNTHVSTLSSSYVVVLLVHSFIHSFIHVFIHSLVHSCNAYLLSAKHWKDTLE